MMFDNDANVNQKFYRTKNEEILNGKLLFLYSVHLEIFNPFRTSVPIYCNVLQYSAEYWRASHDLGKHLRWRAFQQ